MTIEQQPSSELKNVYKSAQYVESCMLLQSKDKLVKV